MTALTVDDEVVKLRDLERVDVGAGHAPVARRVLRRDARGAPRRRRRRSSSSKPAAAEDRTGGFRDDPRRPGRHSKAPPRNCATRRIRTCRSFFRKGTSDHATHTFTRLGRTEVRPDCRLRAGHGGTADLRRRRRRRVLLAELSAQGAVSERRRADERLAGARRRRRGRLGHRRRAGAQRRRGVVQRASTTCATIITDRSTAKIGSISLLGEGAVDIEAGAGRHADSGLGLRADRQAGAEHRRADRSRPAPASPMSRR